MEYKDLTNYGYLAEEGIIEAVAENLLTEEERPKLRGAGARLDRLWRTVSETCPRYLQTKREEARLSAIAAPTDAKALAEYERLVNESADFISTRHKIAHAKFNAAVFEFAQLAAIALGRFKDAVQQRATKAEQLWNEIVELFPGTFTDLPLDKVLRKRVENTLTGLDTRIARLANPSESPAHVELSNLKQLEIASETRTTAGSDYHERA